MKQMKKLSALAAGSMTIALLLGTSLAQAEEVCYEGDVATGIKGLNVITSQFNAITIDVNFVNTSGFDLYGSNLDRENFPFDGAESEEDALATVAAINIALNEEGPVPEFVEISGKKNYYLGVEGEEELSFGLVGAVGGENVTGAEWDLCKESSIESCFGSVAILPAEERFIYADIFPAVSGAQCDGAPPPQGSDFTITPGITGSWYLPPERDGEGYNIEIVGETFAPQLLAYFYTYDNDGNQMWLVGTGPVNGDTAVVPVKVTSGALYGDAFDKDDVDREDWGTLTFTFTSCNAGSVVRASTMGFGTTTYDIQRLTSVISLSCP